MSHFRWERRGVGLSTPGAPVSGPAEPGIVHSRFFVLVLGEGLGEEGFSSVLVKESQI